jgi:hypothetical protein
MALVAKGDVTHRRPRGFLPGAVGEKGMSLARLARFREATYRLLSQAFLYPDDERLGTVAAAARELQQAAEEMRRAAANSRGGGAGRGQTALERLREARRLLERDRSAGLQRELDDALRRAERLAERQRDVISDVERLGDIERGRSERLRRLIERKEEMAGEVADLEVRDRGRPAVLREYAVP